MNNVHVFICSKRLGKALIIVHKVEGYTGVTDDRGGMQSSEKTNPDFHLVERLATSYWISPLDPISWIATAVTRQSLISSTVPDVPLDQLIYEALVGCAASAISTAHAPRVELSSARC